MAIGDEVRYTGANGMKFEANFSLEYVSSTCQTDNQWTEPNWLKCTESKKEIIFFFSQKLISLKANYCPEAPPPPDEGTVKVFRDGLMFGVNCSTGPSFVPMPNNRNWPAEMNNCETPTYQLMSSYVDNSINRIVSEYKLFLSQSGILGGSAATLS